MSIFDAYVDGSIVLSSLPHGKKKVPLKAASRVARPATKMKRTPASAPQPPAGEPPVAEMEQELSELGPEEEQFPEGDAEAEMDAAMAAAAEGGEDPLEGDPNAPTSDPASAGGGGGSSPDASASPTTSEPAASSSSSTPEIPYHEPTAADFRMREMSTYRAPVGPAYSPTVTPETVRDMFSRTARTSSAPATRTATTTRVASPTMTATPTSTVSRAAAPAPATTTTRTATAVKTAAPVARTGATSAARTTAVRTAVRGEDPPFILSSPISGVSDAAWTRFALAVRSAPVGAVSASNALGMFELKARRLEDLKLLKDVKGVRAPNGRMVWTGTFVPPMTAKRFLNDPAAQYQAFAASMADYVRKLRAGEIPKPDGGPTPGITLSGVLAILHRCGPSGLKHWNDAEKRFPDTCALYARANGIF